MTPLIKKNTTIPTKKTQVFSTAEDNQTAVTIHALQGERKKALQNKSLGRFDLTDIPPAPRGTPQIEVAFDLDANGILNITAKDKATGKEQSIIIKSSGGLSDDEINQMIQDAESNKEEDKKFEELVQIRNQADGMIHTIRKTLKEIKNEDEQNKLESLIKKLEETLKNDDIKKIKEDLNKLTEEYSKIYQKIYSDKKSENKSYNPENPETEDSSNKKEGDVVDADYEEVNNKTT